MGPALTDSEQHFLRRAIELARLSREAGEPPFGSLLVSADGAVLAEDHNTTVSEGDITAHPELKLARWAAHELGDRASTVTMYTSCRPCPMCANVISRARLGRVVFALDADQLAGLRSPGFVPLDSAQVPYDGPHLFDEAAVPLREYY
jgi:tRNA(Arg) A34 adenosine deaminase TadA